MCDDNIWVTSFCMIMKVIIINVDVISKPTMALPSQGTQEDEEAFDNNSMLKYHSRQRPTKHRIFWIARLCNLADSPWFSISN